MKAIGMTRKVDELGRFVLPAELRRRMEIDVHDALEIFVEDECIVLKKYEPSCIFCGSAKELFQFNGKHICQKCTDNIKTH